MEEKDKNRQEQGDEELGKKDQKPDDSLKPIEEENEDQPVIYQIYKRGKSLDRKDFIKSAAGVTGLTALGGLFQGCEESEYDIISNGEECVCHAVCTCNSEKDDSDNHEKGNSYSSVYDQTVCTCDTVCTCNSVCTCDSVCTCNTQGGGGGGSYSYTYWYPN